jgi:WD40 repeat protein
MMVCFSPDDRFLLSSGVDNDVRQWNIAQGGCLDLQYQLAPTGLAHNWTRSYYLASGRYIVVGGCREDTVTVACSRTGKIVQQVDLNVEPSVPYSDPMSCLSLRGDPHHPSRFANIVSSCNPRSATRRTKYTLVTVDLCERAPSCPDAMR